MKTYMLVLWLIGLSAAALTAASAEGIVVKKALNSGAAAGRMVLQNAGLDEVVGNAFADWAPWSAGYVVDDRVAHTGKFSARCDSNDMTTEHGMTNTVVLNQTKPVPLVAECWSRAKNVSAALADSAGDYSLYLDLEYMDGTPLWGQVARFSIGTHDWEHKRVVVVPAKPVKSVQVHGIFRHHTGTVWFDDFRLTELDLPAGAASFDTVPVSLPAANARPAGKTVDLKTGDGFALRLDADTGEVIGDQGRRGGFMLRDAAAQGDFRRPLGKVRQEAGQAKFAGSDEALNLGLEATYKAGPSCITIDGLVRDTSGKDRGIGVYFALPLDAVGWTWSQDIRRSETIRAGEAYAYTTGVGAGTTRNASLFPLAAVSGPQQGVAAAAPMDEPRLCRLSYDAASRELFVAFDLGLTSETAKFPSAASFHIQLFRFDPQWQYRAALSKYYALNPEAFRKRVTKEGIWMPFTDIATVAGYQDFGFMFHEGDNNPTFDHEHGFLSFVYVEPMSFWMAMAKDTPRTIPAAMAQLAKQAKQGPDQGHAQATYNSNLGTEDGQPAMSFQNAPWCDGALFINNPDPAIKGTPEYPKTQFDLHWDTINTSIWGSPQVLKGWTNYGQGFEFDATGGRDGKGAAKCAAVEAGQQHGLVQSVHFDQAKTTPLIARAWSKAENVTGDPGNDYSLYCDLTYTDGTPGWGFMTPFNTGTHDWQMAEVRIVPAKPVAQVAFNLLFRGQRTGTVWFDDASLAVEGTDTNLLANPGIEMEKPVERVVDGNYIDSSEMAASDLDFRREHWRDISIPLTFTADDARPAQMIVFATRDFTKEIASRLHPKGKLMFANATPWRFPWFAPYLDILGTETNWVRDGKYVGEGDEIMCYRRQVCDQKPYCLLQNTDFANWPMESTEKYFKRCAAYGVFPGFFSADAASNCYFERPELYNRDRPLFITWIPIIKDLAKAGWEPVTFARSTDPKMYVERFGSAQQGNLHFTVFNDTGKEQTATLGIDLKGAEIKGTPSAVDAVTKAAQKLDVRGGKAAWAGTLKADDVAVFEVK